jgi:hypothetical protein
MRLSSPWEPDAGKSEIVSGILEKALTEREPLELPEPDRDDAATRQSDELRNIKSCVIKRAQLRS